MAKLFCSIEDMGATNYPRLTLAFFMAKSTQLGPGMYHWGKPCFNNKPSLTLTLKAPPIISRRRQFQILLLFKNNK